MPPNKSDMIDSSTSIFKQSTIWRITLSAEVPDPKTRNWFKTYTADVIDTHYRYISLQAAHHILEQHNINLDLWNSMTVTISKIENPPIDPV